MLFLFVAAGDGLLDERERREGGTIKAVE